MIFRSLTRSLLCLAVMAPVALAPVTATAQSTVDSREIAPGILLLPGQLQPRFSPDGNSVILTSDQGVLVVDTGRGGLHTRHLIQLLRQLGQPVVAALNTHWHLDHIGGNALLREAFPSVSIHAHPSLDAALEGFHLESRAQLESRMATLPQDAPDWARQNAELELLRRVDRLFANEKVRESGRWTVAGRTLERRVSPGSVTEGDVWLFEPDSRTLIAGDLVTLPVPLFDTACPERWQDALRQLGSQDFKLLVPGHGNPLTPATFKQYRKAYDNLLQCAGNRKKEDAACIDGWLSDAGSLVLPSQVEMSRQLLSYYLPNHLRKDAPGRQRWCR